MKAHTTSADDISAFKAQIEIQASDEFEVKVAKLVLGWTFWPREELVIPVWATSLNESMSLKAFREVLKPHCLVEIGPRGGRNVINPVDRWSEQLTRRCVDGLQMRPDQSPGLFQEGGNWFINSYRRPVHGEPDPTALSVFHQFMKHLNPDPVEREFSLDWMAHKYQHPEIPGPGVLMVAKQQGAGRGTLFRINEQLFGKAYVAKMDASVLFGDGSGQGQYTNQVAGSILCQIDEVMNTSANLSVGQRNKTYNRLKMLIEPGKRSMELIQKGIASRTVTVFASFLMATNNENALPAEEGDRRIAVITNGGPLHENPELYAALRAFQPDGDFTEGFIAAVAEFLDARDVSGFDALAPAPMFKGKRLMIDLNTNAAADAVEEVLANLPADLVAFKDLLDHVKAKFAYGEVPNHLREEVKDAAGRMWIAIGLVKINEKGCKALVYARNTGARDLWAGSALAIRSGLLAMNAKLSGSEAMRDLHEKQSIKRGDQRPRKPN